MNPQFDIESFHKQRLNGIIVVMIGLIFSYLAHRVTDRVMGYEDQKSALCSENGSFQDMIDCYNESAEDREKLDKRYMLAMYAVGAGSVFAGVSMSDKKYKDGRMRNVGAGLVLGGSITVAYQTMVNWRRFGRDMQTLVLIAVLANFSYMSYQLTE